MVPRKLAALCTVFASMSGLIMVLLGFEFLRLEMWTHGFVAAVAVGINFAVGSACLYPEWFLKESDHE